MDNELNKDRRKVQSLSTTTDVLNTTEEVKEFNKLIESSEKTPETSKASIDGN